MTTEQVSPNEGFDAPTWAPFRFGLFRLLWLAQLSAYIGIWMHTVAAQWVLVTQNASVITIALIQAAISVPMVLLILPSGVLADVLDRRHLLIFAHSFQFVVSASLAYLAFGHKIEPRLLLLLTFLLACGTAMATPTWQALLFDLVPRDHIPAVAALNGVNVNVARAVGPAIAGLLIGSIGTSQVFTIIALTFTVVLTILLALKRDRISNTVAPERLIPALSSGVRYVRHSREILRGLLHASLFSLPAIGLWALLPEVAHGQLGMSAAGYGLLLSMLGIGAIAGAWALTAIRSRIADPALLTLTGVGYAISAFAVASTNSSVVAAAASLMCGATWLTTYAVLSGSIQLALPPWVRARGVSIFLLVVMLAQTTGSVLWGVLSEWYNQRTALVISAVVLALAAFISYRWPLLVDASDRRESRHWPQPTLSIDPQPRAPVLVSTVYRVPMENSAAFISAMQEVRRSRRRTGAVRWRLYQDGADPQRFVEIYRVSSWDEHLRQHGGRLTVADRLAEEAATSLTDGSAPMGSHLLPVDRRTARRK